MKILENNKLSMIAGGRNNNNHNNNNHHNNNHNNNHTNNPADGNAKLHIIQNGLANGNSWATIGQNIGHYFANKYGH